jgi:hypothetical protein
MKAIETKFLGPTNARGSRVKAFDEAGNSIIKPWDHSCGSEENHKRAAIALAAKLNPRLAHVGTGALKNTNVHLFKFQD